MAKTILIDDEPLARQLIRSFLKSHPEVEIAAECGDGFEGFKAITDHAPDFIFLDVQMPRLTGFEMLELIDTPPPVIFTTAYDEYAVRAFEAQAVDYLMKPIQRDRFDRAVKKVLSLATPASPDAVALAEGAAGEGYQHRIVVKDGGSIRIIPAIDILYLEADDDYVRVFTPGAKFLKKATLTRLEKTLDPQQFVRVHRSYIIPVGSVAKIEPYEKESHIAILHSGARVPVSKAGLARLKEVLRW